LRPDGRFDSIGTVLRTLVPLPVSTPARSLAGSRIHANRDRQRHPDRLKMDFGFPIFALPPAAEQLRVEVREFVAREIDAGRWQPHGDFASHYDAGFSRRLGERGWLGMTWPCRYGGHMRTMLERLVVTEELLAASAPVAAHWIADRQSGPLLLKFGTEAQRLAYLPRIARGEIFFSIGMSEPEAGSDLAAVRTRARKVDRGWRLDGRKVWTTFAHRNDYAITLVRTGEAGDARHGGLSQFIVDLKAPDVSVTPIVNMAGGHEFNEVVFDGSFVPDDALIGIPGNGWAQVTSELAYERSGPERYLSSIRLAEVAVRIARSAPTPRVLEALGRMAARLAALRAMSVSVAAMLQNGRMPNLEAALIKDLGNAFERELIEVVRRIQPDLPRAEPSAIVEFDSALDEATLYAPSWSLRGGTREILRGIVARGLGLR
jgi:acyl-CoA dehydrogenase